MVRLFAVFAICGLTLAGCQPIEVNPANPTGQPGTVLVSSRPSVLTVPVTVQLQDIAALVNKEAPTYVQGTYPITVNVPHVHFHGALKKPTVTHDPVQVAHIDWHANRGPITLGGSNDAISVHVSFSGGGKLIPTGATADASGTADGSSSLTVAPDYSFRPVVNLGVNISQANVLHGISVKGLVQGAVSDKINQFEGSIGPAVTQLVNLRKYAQTAWDRIPGCLLLPGTSDVWITIQPQAVMLEGPHAANDSVTAVLALKAAVATLYQPNRPGSPQRPPVPNITGYPADDKFHIDLPVQIQTEELNKTLAELIRNDHISTVPLGDGQVISLNEISVFPYGNRFYLKVNFAGVKGKLVKHVRGTFIFVAHPVLSADKQSLSFDNINYSDQTANTLKGLGLEVLLTVGKPIIVGIIQKRVVLQFSPYLEKAKATANSVVAQLKFPAPFRLDFNLSALTPEDLDVYGNNIFLRFDASGSARVTF